MNNKEFFGMKIWISGNFKLLQTEHFDYYVRMGINLNEFPLELQQAIIIDDDKIMVSNGNIFLIDSELLVNAKKF